MPYTSDCNLNLILNTITDGIIVVDDLGSVLYANESAERIFEKKPLIGHFLGIPINPSITSPQEINLIRPSGLGWAELRSSPLEWNGKIAYLIGVRDITQEKLDADKLRQAATVFDNTHEGIMITDVELHILRVNQAFCDISGYTEKEVLGKFCNVLRSGRHNSDFYSVMWKSIKENGHWQGEIWNRRKNGETYPELLSISVINDDKGNILNYVGVFADISKLKASELELDFLAHHDPLTRLPNRLLLLSRLEHALKVAEREHKIVALLMLDLDRFKDINDTLGHLAGDKLLQQVAKSMTDRLRCTDTICRLGGDEFTILLEDINHVEDAAKVATDIINALSEPWQIMDNEVRIGVSVGISIYPDHGNEPEKLLQYADTALYHAKAEGKGCYRYFSEAITVAARNRMDIEIRLKRGILNGELRVFYQPQLDVKTGRIIGAEALVRWQDPRHGLVSPNSFIALAEKTGLIHSIGQWVLKEVCYQGVYWQSIGLAPINLAVNVSPHQFRYCQIDTMLANILSETGFPPERLELELTESTLMQRENETVLILHRLHDLGVRIAIDDFGTGYSSLAYLKLFPLDILKIDKSFIDDIPHSQSDIAITSTIIAIAHTLNFKVLAEGVENQEQLNFLKSHGCDLYQGYFFSQPLSAKDFESLLVQKNHF